MLVLTRRAGEEIVIGKDIILTVVTVKGDRVRLGISAPSSVCVDRREVRQRRTEFAANKEDLQPLLESVLIREAMSGSTRSESYPTEARQSTREDSHERSSLRV